MEVTAVVCKSTTRKRLGSEPAQTRKSFVAYLPQYNYRKKNNFESSVMKAE